MGTVRIVVADDQADIRSGFKQILDSVEDFVVVGEAADGEAALELVGLLHPDVLLADIRMPRMDGLRLCRAVTERPVEPGRGPTRVIVVTTFDLDEYVAEALHHGAHGFLLKRSRPELLVEAVHAAVSGDTLVSPQVTVRLLRHAARTNPHHQGYQAASVLTPREAEIARSVAAGRTNNQIGQQLYITPGTVKTHVANIQAKLGVANRVGIAAWAWAVGVADPGNTGSVP
jgi:DNA-binding NarL/FixJ family response regulator